MGFWVGEDGRNPWCGGVRQGGGRSDMGCQVVS